ncbi:hypothetical protein D3C71_1180720 [compost metagenome]
MSQTAGAIGLGQIDDDGTALEVGRGSTLTSTSTGPEGQPQRTIERQRSGFDAQHAGQVEEPVIGIIQIPLPASILHIVAELHAAEAECLAELRRRHVRAGAMINAHARFIGVAPLGRDVLQLLKLLLQIRLVLGTIGARFLQAVERGYLQILTADLLCDRKPGFRIACGCPVSQRENFKARRCTGSWGGAGSFFQRLECLNGGLPRISLCQRLGPALASRAGFNGVDRPGRVVARAVVNRVSAGAQGNSLQALVVANSLIEVHAALQLAHYCGVLRHQLPELFRVDRAVEQASCCIAQNLDLTNPPLHLPRRDRPVGDLISGSPHPGNREWIGTGIQQLLIVRLGPGL